MRSEDWNSREKAQKRKKGEEKSHAKTWRGRAATKEKSHAKPQRRQGKTGWENLPKSERFPEIALQRRQGKTENRLDSHKATEVTKVVFIEGKGR
jgi:hypothetical protein